MEKVVERPGSAYWGVLPSRFGAGRYVKYKLEPEAAPGGEPTRTTTTRSTSAPTSTRV